MWFNVKSNKLLGFKTYIAFDTCEHLINAVGLFVHISSNNLAVRHVKLISNRHVSHMLHYYYLG
jgi:hypothetical protein